MAGGEGNGAAGLLVRTGGTLSWWASLSPSWRPVVGVPRSPWDGPSDRALNVLRPGGSGLADLFSRLGGVCGRSHSQGWNYLIIANRSHHWDAPALLVIILNIL